MVTAQGEPAPHRVFLSYRRTDARREAANLQSGIDLSFGDGTVFLDEESIHPGEDWPKSLENALAAATVVLVVIGPEWCRALDDPQFGTRQIDRPNDWPRREVEAAFAQHKVLIPVFVCAAPMPPPHVLPASLQPISAIQGFAFDEAQWGRDLKALCAELARRLHQEPHPLPPQPPGALAAYRQLVRRQHAHLASFFPAANKRLLDEVCVQVQIARDAPELGREVREQTLRTLFEDPATEPSCGPLLVQGPPGAGKTTLARHLTWQVAGEADGPVAVYLPLPHWARSGTLHPFDLAEAALQAAEGPRVGAGLAATLRSCAQQRPGRVWLLLDGLDEVAPEHWTDTLARVAALRSPGVRIVVLSRPLEGEQRTAAAAFAAARLLPLAPAAQQRLLQAWLGEAHGKEVYTQIHAAPELATLIDNPLLLTLLARLAQDGKTLPLGRCDLYKQAIDLLLRTPWGRQRESIRCVPEVRHALGELALALQQSPAAAWSLSELYEALRLVRKRDERTDEALIAVAQGDGETFLREVAQRTGVLAPHEADDVWRFFHRQFREFLAAEAMARSARPWQEFLGGLDEANLTRWSETLGLYCGLVEQPGAVLQQLRQHSPKALVRALGDVVGVAVSDLIEMLWKTPTDVRSLIPDWNGDDLRRLVVAWVGSGTATAREVSARLWMIVEPSLTVVQQAWLHWALSAVEVVDRRRFFAACGRPVERAPKLGAVAVLAGTFLMGSLATEAERSESEGPQHRVDVAAFWLCREAVTNAGYALFDDKHAPQGWEGVKPGDLTRHPVVKVGWWAAYLYCRWLGDDVRLPSEAEWEYACRADTSTPFSFGATITPKQVNYDGNYPYGSGKKGAYRQRTVPVGSLPANGWGLHEMHGNVWEWCQDCWHDSYEGAPADGTAWEEVGSGDRVLRGGSWLHNARFCRSASRGGWHPGSRSGDVGFRPASSSPDFFTTSPLGRASKLRPTNPS